MGSYYFLPIYHVLVLWLSLMSLINYSVGAKYKWDVEYMFWSPDCQKSMVMGINGQFPGPTIRAKAGDTIEIELTNKLHTEGVVIHWHGIRQIGTPWADGTASISQCAINPGETFTYRFKVDKPGTYFYHGHYGMQRAAGLYGSLIVDVPEGESEPFHYNGEFNLLLTDWSHRSVHEQSVGLSSRPSHWFGEPQSLLINGRGQYNCSMVAVYNKSSTMSQCKFTGNEQCAPEIMHVLPNKTYRLRLASTTAIASLNLAIGNHTMLVVEADGNYVKPFETSDLDIYSGESYSVLIRTDQNPLDNYWITLGVIGRKSPTPPTYAILKYHNITESELPSFPPPITPPWNDYNRSKSFTNKILAKMGSPQPPKTHDRRLLLLNSQANIDGYNKLAINNISLVLPPTPYLGAIKYGLKGAFDEKSPPDNFPEDYDVMNPPPYTSAFFGNGAYTLEYNQTIDVILQNANVITKNLSHVHPWHLHGHDFWILGYGEGKFTEADVSKFNLENPPLKNTAVLFPFGWTALRFVTDNPGVWIFHCHIESHLHMGMGVIFAEAVHLVKKIPNEALTCGLTAKMFLEQNHTTVGH